MGGCRCVFRKCPVRTSQYPGMHFFTFPINDKERYKRWLAYADTMYFLEMPLSFQKNRVVCARHFRDECFMNYKRDRLNPTAEPTLFRLNDEMALDYSQALVTGSPELIKTPKSIMKHLIPPPTYIFPFSFHDNLNVFDYLEQNEIVLSKSEEAEKQQNKTKRSRNDAISTELKRLPKKIKILNSAATISAGESASTTSVLNIQLNDERTMLNIPLDSVEYRAEKTNYISDEDMNDEGEEYDLEIFEDYITEEMKEKEDVTESEQGAEQDGIMTAELLARINKLENELKESKEELRCKTNELTRTEIELEKVKSELNSLSKNHEELCKNYKNNIEINKISCKKIKKLEQEKTQIENKCLEYEKHRQEKEINPVSICPAPTTSTTNEISTTNRRQHGPQSSYLPINPTKAQLFNGVKKYTSSSMLALLRMEMFGGADREWKPDERRVAKDLLQLGEEVYKYFSDEWRFRLPALSEVRNWLTDVTNPNDFDEDI